MQEGASTSGGSPTATRSFCVVCCIIHHHSSRGGARANTHVHKNLHGAIFVFGQINCVLGCVSCSAVAKSSCLCK